MITILDYPPVEFRVQAGKYFGFKGRATLLDAVGRNYHDGFRANQYCGVNDAKVLCLSHKTRTYT